MGTHPMSDTDFLKKVQSDNGLTVIVGINPADKDDVIPRYAATEEEVEQAIAYFKRRGFHTYYGVAKYATANNRKAENVQSLKALWLDVDCNKIAPKGYPSKGEGQSALDQFTAKYDLPTPATVDSGNGIHAYWPLTEEVTPEEWRPVSDALKAACQAEGFYIDPSVMEEARIMRVPGTTNYKDGGAKPVSVLNDYIAPISLTEFAEKLGTIVPQPQKSIFGKSGRGPSKLGKALAEGANQYAPADFGKITAACQHIAACIDNRATLSEPLWRAALSVAIRCTDPEPAVAAVSEDWTNGTEEYDFDASMEKARATKGPYTCAQFDSLDPSGCDGCPLRTVHADGSVTYKHLSPIRLGEVQFMGGPTARTQPLPNPEDVPTYPPGYYRPDDGGVAKFAKNPEERDQIIYDDDLYITQRLYAAKSETEAFVLRLHLPHDPVREFSLPSGMLGDNQSFKKFLYEKGLCFSSEAEYVLVKNYLNAFVKHFQRRESATPVYEQFGWAEDDSKFILGDQEITADGVAYSPPLPITRPFAESMHSSGTLDEWKRVFAIYGEPGMEGHAFAALTGFGAPLYKFLGQNGAIINLVSPDSGTGKTTTLRLVNSIYGHPDKLLSAPDDTYNARVAKLGIFNNLPYCTDEMTNLSPEDLSRMLYSMSQGRGKDRMSGNTNALRENNTTWQTISLCSSNASFASKLQGLKSNPDGELMRLLEFELEKKKVNIKKENKALVDIVLAQNYGHAGLLYIDYVLRNRAKAAYAVTQAQDKLIDELSVEQHERFWVSAVAANLTGGFIAGNRLGLLIGWDLGRIRAWAIDQFNNMRQERITSLTSAEGVLGNFLNLHHAAIVVVNNNKASRATIVDPPKGEITIRLEPDTKEMFIVQKNFSKFCIDLSIDPKRTIRELMDKKIIISYDHQKKMGAGTTIPSTNVKTLRLDYKHPAFDAMPAIPNAVGT